MQFRQLRWLTEGVGRGWRRRLDEDYMMVIDKIGDVELGAWRNQRKTCTGNTDTIIYIAATARLSTW